MNTPTETGQRAALSDYLAAERTFLAWIRTGLALMGFGFVVARFGLFLQQLQIFRQAGAPPPSTGISLWFGTALIVVALLLGAAVVVVAWKWPRGITPDTNAVVPPDRNNPRGPDSPGDRDILN